MKVKTKDFQILKGEHEFEFPVGITILQGESASGKSSLFYAVKNCLTNPSGVDYCINWDAKQTEVTIENNGESVTWIKTGSSSEYINNKTGETFIKASKLDSRNIADLGFYFDHKDNVVNIHDEWSVLFPFGFSDTEMFKQFEEIFNISSTYQVVDDIKKDEQIKKSQIGQISDNINLLTQKQNQISQILETVDKERVQDLIDILTQKQQVIEQIQQDFHNLSKNNTLKTLVVPAEYDMTNLINSGSVYESIKLDLENYLVNYNLKNTKVPELVEFNIQENPYCKDYTDYVTTLDILKQYKTELDKLDIQEKALKEQLSQIKVCPTCGRPLDE